MANLTKEKLKKEFFSDIKNITHYCAREKATKEEALELMAFMFLALIDGVGSNGTPSPISLVVTGHSEEQINDLKENESDWVEEDTVINDDCYLHDSLGDIGLVPRDFYPQIITRYRELIENKGENLPVTQESYASKEHLLSMLNTLSTDALQSLSKKHRWLGYIQGTLCAHGLTTVDTERDFTRRIFNGN